MDQSEPLVPARALEDEEKASTASVAQPIQPSGALPTTDSKLTEAVDPEQALVREAASGSPVVGEAGGIVVAGGEDPPVDIVPAAAAAAAALESDTLQNRTPEPEAPELLTEQPPAPNISDSATRKPESNQAGVGDGAETGSEVKPESQEATVPSQAAGDPAGSGMHVQPTTPRDEEVRLQGTNGEKQYIGKEAGGYENQEQPQEECRTGERETGQAGTTPASPQAAQAIEAPQNQWQDSAIAEPTAADGGGDSIAGKGEDIGEREPVPGSELAAADGEQKHQHAAKSAAVASEPAEDLKARELKVPSGSTPPAEVLDGTSKKVPSAETQPQGDGGTHPASAGVATNGMQAHLNKSETNGSNGGEQEEDYEQDPFEGEDIEVVKNQGSTSEARATKGTAAPGKEGAASGDVLQQSSACPSGSGDTDMPEHREQVPQTNELEVLALGSSDRELEARDEVIADLRAKIQVLEIRAMQAEQATNNARYAAQVAREEGAFSPIQRWILENFGPLVRGHQYKFWDKRAFAEYLKTEKADSEMQRIAEVLPNFLKAGFEDSIVQTKEATEQIESEAEHEEAVVSGVCAALIGWRDQIQHLHDEFRREDLVAKRKVAVVVDEIGRVGKEGRPLSELKRDLVSLSEESAKCSAQASLAKRFAADAEDVVGVLTEGPDYKFATARAEEVIGGNSSTAVEIEGFQLVLQHAMAKRRKEQLKLRKTVHDNPYRLSPVMDRVRVTAEIDRARKMAIEKAKLDLENRRHQAHLDSATFPNSYKASNRTTPRILPSKPMSPPRSAMRRSRKANSNHRAVVQASRSATSTMNSRRPPLTNQKNCQESRPTASKSGVATGSDRPCPSTSSAGKS